jgi:hypothetical protein
MMFHKHNWSCSICGQGFTRKTSAKRHNKNLHSANGVTIRTQEYIIGRLQGKFHSAIDPLEFRQKSHPYQQNRSGVVHVSQSSYTPASHEKNYANSPKPSPVESPRTYEETRSYEWPPIPDTQKKLDPRLASTLGQDLKRNAKLQEIGILAHRYYIPEKAREVAKLAAAAYAIRDDGHLDLMLNNLSRGFSPY